MPPQTQQIYCTPEFNGDRTELLQMGSMDSCDKDWPEIFGLFSAVKTLDAFSIANEKAQGLYHSFLDDICLEPVETILEAEFLHTLAAAEFIRLNILRMRGK